MGFKVAHKDAAEFENHPEGWHAFQVLTCEEAESEFKGKKTLRYRWECMSRLKKDDGTEFVLSVWTGREMVNDERCKLKQLTEACQIDSVAFDDTDELIGCWFAGKCVAGKTDSTKGFVNIVDFDTIERVRPVKKAAPKAKGTQGLDPFAEE